MWKNICASVLGLMALCFASVHAEASRLPVSSACKNAKIPAGEWYAVREMTPRRMRGLRSYHRRMHRRQPDVFGGDYCTFERHLVFANLENKRGFTVNDRMSNLGSRLLMPVKSEKGAHWICFRPDPANDPDCKGRPSLVASRMLSSGATLWDVRVEPPSVQPSPAQTQAERSAPTQPTEETRSVQAPPADLKTQLDRLENSNVQIITHLGTLQSAYATQLRQLSDQKRKLDELSASLTTVATQLKSLQTTPADQQKTVDGVIAKLDSLPAAINGQLEELQKRTTQHIDTLLGSQEAQQKGRIATLSDQIDSGVKMLSDGLRQNALAIDQLKSELASAKAAQEALPASAAPAYVPPWLYVALAILSLALLICVIALALALAGWRRAYENEEGWDEQPPPRQHVLKRIDEEVPTAPILQAPKAEIEPGNEVPITVPKDLPGGGKERIHRVYMKTLRTDGDSDIWVLPEHRQKELGTLTSKELLETINRNPRSYLVMQRNLIAHWKGCDECKKILAEEDCFKAEPAREPEPA